MAISAPKSVDRGIFLLLALRVRLERLTYFSLDSTIGIPAARLDLKGTQPKPDEIKAFVTNADSAKRDKEIDGIQRQASGFASRRAI